MRSIFDDLKMLANNNKEEDAGELEEPHPPTPDEEPRVQMNAHMHTSYANLYENERQEEQLKPSKSKCCNRADCTPHAGGILKASPPRYRSDTTTDGMHGGNKTSLAMDARCQADHSSYGRSKSLPAYQAENTYEELDGFHPQKGNAHQLGGGTAEIMQGETTPMMMQKDGDKMEEGYPTDNRPHQKNNYQQVRFHQMGPHQQYEYEETAPYSSEPARRKLDLQHAEDPWIAVKGNEMQAKSLSKKLYSQHHSRSCLQHSNFQSCHLVLTILLLMSVLGLCLYVHLEVRNDHGNEVVHEMQDRLDTIMKWLPRMEFAVKRLRDSGNFRDPKMMMRAAGSVGGISLRTINED